MTSVEDDTLSITSSADTDMLNEIVNIAEKREKLEVWLAKPSNEDPQFTNKELCDRKQVLVKSRVRTSVPCLASVIKYKLKKSELDELYNNLLKHAVID